MALIRHPKDFWAGVLFMTLGGAGMFIAMDYAMGTAGRMGPGYVPRWLGGILMFLGTVLILRSFRLQGEAIAFAATGLDYYTTTEGATPALQRYLRQ